MRLLVADELISNAHQHAVRPGRLRGARIGENLMVEVGDHGPDVTKIVPGGGRFPGSTTSKITGAVQDVVGVGPGQAAHSKGRRSPESTALSAGSYVLWLEEDRLGRGEGAVAVPLSALAVEAAEGVGVPEEQAGVATAVVVAGADVGAAVAVEVALDPL